VLRFALGILWSFLEEPSSLLDLGPLFLGLGNVGLSLTHGSSQLLRPFGIFEVVSARRITFLRRLLFFLLGGGLFVCGALFIGLAFIHLVAFPKRPAEGPLTLATATVKLVAPTTALETMNGAPRRGDRRKRRHGSS
jgi:hypothetical protein